MDDMEVEGSSEKKHDKDRESRIRLLDKTCIFGFSAGLLSSALSFFVAAGYLSPIAIALLVYAAGASVYAIWLSKRWRNISQIITNFVFLLIIILLVFVNVPVVLSFYAPTLIAIHYNGNGVPNGPIDPVNGQISVIRATFFSSMANGEAQITVINNSSNIVRINRFYIANETNYQVNAYYAKQQSGLLTYYMNCNTTVLAPYAHAQCDSEITVAAGPLTPQLYTAEINYTENSSTLNESYEFEFFYCLGNQANQGWGYVTLSC